MPFNQCHTKKFSGKEGICSTSTVCPPPSQLISCPAKCEPTVIEIPQICLKEKLTHIQPCDCPTIYVPKPACKSECVYVQKPKIKIQPCKPKICEKTTQIEVPKPCIKRVRCEVPKPCIEHEPCEILKPRINRIDIDVPKPCPPELLPPKVCCVPCPIKVPKIKCKSVDCCVKPKIPSISIECPQFCPQPVDICVPKLCPKSEKIKVIKPMICPIPEPCPCPDGKVKCPPCIPSRHKC